MLLGLRRLLTLLKHSDGRSEPSPLQFLKGIILSELTHAEMQKWHYQAVKNNPFYRLEGMMDVFFENLSYQMPYHYPPEPVEQKLPPVPAWTSQQRDYVQQLKGQMLHLEKKVDTLSQEKRKQRSKYD